MRCPFCQNTMESGFVQSGNLMVWVKKKHYVSLFPKEGEVLLDCNYLSGAMIPAHICKSCKKIIAEYEEKDSEF